LQLKIIYNFLLKILFKKLSIFPFYFSPPPHLYLKRKTIRRIIHNDHILQLPINHPEILDIHSLQRLDATVPEQPVLDELVLRVQVVEDHVRVAGVAGCEDYQLEEGGERGEEGLGEGADVYARLE
jgi:hypothetical protein